MAARTSKEKRAEEQSRADAHRHGISAYKAGEPRSANPFLGIKGKELLAHAWDRAWAAEQRLFGKNVRETR
jgi:hypothetical protein